MTKSNNLNRADVVKIDNIPDSENEKASTNRGEKRKQDTKNEYNKYMNMINEDEREDGDDFTNI